MDGAARNRVALVISSQAVHLEAGLAAILGTCSLKVQRRAPIHVAVAAAQNLLQEAAFAASKASSGADGGQQEESKSAKSAAKKPGKKKAASKSVETQDSAARSETHDPRQYVPPPSHVQELHQNEIIALFLEVDQRRAAADPLLAAAARQEGQAAGDGAQPLESLEGEKALSAAIRRLRQVIGQLDPEWGRAALDQPAAPTEAATEDGDSGKGKGKGKGKGNDKKGKDKAASSDDPASSPRPQAQAATPAEQARQIGSGKPKGQTAGLQGSTLALWQRTFDPVRPPVLVKPSKRGYAESLGSISDDDEDEEERGVETGTAAAAGGDDDDADSVTGVSAGHQGRVGFADGLSGDVERVEEDEADEGVLARVRAGEWHPLLIVPPLSLEHGRKMVQLLEAAELQSLSSALERTESNVVAVRARMVKRGWQRVDHLMEFVFPADLQTPRSTGRLLLLCECGPLDDEGNLRGGRGGMHVLRSHELKLMMDEIEAEDALEAFLGSGIAGGLPERERVGILASLRDAIREMPRVSEGQVRRVLRGMHKDSRHRIEFAQLQKYATGVRRQRVAELREVAGGRASQGKRAKKYHVSPPAPILGKGALAVSGRPTRSAYTTFLHATQRASVVPQGTRLRDSSRPPSGATRSPPRTSGTWNGEAGSRGRSTAGFGGLLGEEGTGGEETKTGGGGGFGGTSRSRLGPSTAGSAATGTGTGNGTVGIGGTGTSEEEEQAKVVRMIQAARRGRPPASVSDLGTAGYGLRGPMDVLRMAGVPAEGEKAGLLAATGAADAGVGGGGLSSGLEGRIGKTGAEGRRQERGKGKGKGAAAAAETGTMRSATRYATVHGGPAGGSPRAGEGTHEGTHGGRSSPQRGTGSRVNRGGADGKSGSGRTVGKKALHAARMLDPSGADDEAPVDGDVRAARVLMLASHGKAARAGGMGRTREDRLAVAASRREAASNRRRQAAGSAAALGAAGAHAVAAAVSGAAVRPVKLNSTSRSGYFDPAVRRSENSRRREQEKMLGKNAHLVAAHTGAAKGVAIATNSLLLRREAPAAEDKWDREASLRRTGLGSRVRTHKRIY